MDDLISRKELLDNLNRFAPEHYNALVNQLIEKQPAVEPADCEGCRDEEFGWSIGECHRCMRSYEDLYKPK